jgi:hypothetical protein
MQPENKEAREAVAAAPSLGSRKDRPNAFNSTAQQRQDFCNPATLAVHHFEDMATQISEFEVKWLTKRGLKITKTTLQKIATLGGGPAYSIFGSRAVYTPQNLDAWAGAKLSAPRTSTSKAA